MSNDWTKMWESKPTPKQEETKVRILPETEPDWQHYRIQAAIAVMQAHISDGEHMAMISRNLNHNDEAVTKLVAKVAVMYAEALIAELQKKGRQDESDNRD